MDSKSGMLFSDSLYYYVLCSNYGDLGRISRVLHYEPMVESEENVDSDANLEGFGGKR